MSHNLHNNSLHVLSPIGFGYLLGFPTHPVNVNEMLAKLILSRQTFLGKQASLSMLSVSPPIVTNILSADT